MLEVWVTIKGFNGRYLISDSGNVKSLLAKRLLTQSNRMGYLRVTLSKNAGFQIFSVHRLVVEAFIPNPKKLDYVNHLDGNKNNNNLSNLEWVDGHSNNIHCYKTKLKQTKLSFKLAEQIRSELFACKRCYSRIARKYGVTRHSIEAIAKDRFYKKEDYV